MRRCTSAFARALLLGAAALIGAAGTAWAQGAATIRGTVVDSVSRQPIPGVQLGVIGTSLGAQTDASGRYLIRGVPAGTATLRAQRIGFAAQTRSLSVAAGQEAVADFVMRAQAAVLSEVVVVGYGTQSRADVSNAVANVRGEVVQNVPTAGIDAALQGRAPGVQVVQNAGNPGNGITIRVRGSSSISASNQPLFVIDGVPMIREDYSQLDFGGQDITAVTGLSPDEIESIDVLKDASAAAIYGSRGSNGVVMITTKRGRPGTTKFSFNTYYGQQTVARKMQLLNARQYVDVFKEALLNDGYTEDDVADFGYTLFPGADSAGTDWLAAVTRDAPVADFNINASGGGDRFQYLISGSNFNQQGIVLGSGYDRQNARLNLDVTATPKLQFRSSIGLVRENFKRTTNDNTIEGASANAIAVQPNIPLYKPGSCAAGRCVYSGTDEGLEYVNPVAVSAFNLAPTRSFRTIGSLEAAWDVTDRLRLNGRVGADLYTLNERRWESPQIEGLIAAGVGGQATQSQTEAQKYLSEFYANWDPVRSATQKLTITAGTGLEFNRSEYVYLQGQGFASEEFQYPGSAGEIILYDAGPSENRLLSFFSRANYNLKDRYLLTASLRTDGASRFASGNRFGVFPAASFGWVVSEEPMFGGLRDLMSAKLRLSYGETGNQAIGSNFGFLTTFSRANFAGEPGLAPAQLGNPNLRWETTREFDVGTDLGFFGGRVSLIADYYIKKTDDLLVSRPISSVSGFTSILENVGNLENRGWELQLSTENVRSPGRNGFTWTTDFNVSSNRNKVTALFRDEPIISGIRSVNRVEVGQPIGAFYAIKFLGVDPQTGNACFEDIERNDAGAIISRERDCEFANINSDDRQIVGAPHPDFFGGFRNQFTWKGFDLNTFLEFSQGGEVFNLVRLYADDGAYYNDNKLTHVLDRWQKPGDVTDVPRLSWDGTSFSREVSSRFVEDASYVRLQEVTLGWRVPRGLLGRTGMSEARLYVSGRNLKLWSDYLGYDPDVNSNGSGSNVSLGQDFYAYPRARTISFGISGTW